MTFTNLKNELLKEYEELNKKDFEYLNKYDEFLKQSLTAKRLTQYTNNEITKDQAIEYAYKRILKRNEKRLNVKLEKLERISNAPELTTITIVMEWTKSNTWGMNPHAYITTDTEQAEGHASGCGYDKESAAMAKALNACDSVLKALYTYKENQLNCMPEPSGNHDNRHIIAYGAGYDTLPYFEGGTGVKCLLHILDLLGYEYTWRNLSKHKEIYTFTKR